jgi:hypothetical protein
MIFRRVLSARNVRPIAETVFSEMPGHGNCSERANARSPELCACANARSPGLPAWNFRPWPRLSTPHPGADRSGHRNASVATVCPKLAIVIAVRAANPREHAGRGPVGLRPGDGLHRRNPAGSGSASRGNSASRPHRQITPSSSCSCPASQKARRAMTARWSAGRDEGITRRNRCRSRHQRFPGMSAAMMLHTLTPQVTRVRHRPLCTFRTRSNHSPRSLPLVKGKTCSSGNDMLPQSSGSALSEATMPLMAPSTTERLSGLSAPTMATIRSTRS